MCKFNPSNDSRRIDPCMKKILWLINNKTNYKTLSSCCGHGKYPMTIVVTRGYGDPIEYFSDKFISRKKKFYKKDKQGFYFIPEVIHQNG